MSTYKNAEDLDFFEKDFELLSEYIIKDILGKEIDISDDLTLRRSAWVASLLSSSSDDSHRNKALDFGVLAYHYAEKELEETNKYKELLYIIAARAGSLPTMTYFEDFHEINDAVIAGSDGILSLELVGEEWYWEVSEGEFLTKFQKDIWEGLEKEVNLSISGPTSSGKSHIIKQFLNKRISEDDDFEAVYSVPTRALISENATKIRGTIAELGKEDQIEVRTGGASESSQDSVVYVLTPERCLNLIRNQEFQPDMIFIDEIQNIGDDNRGVLYEIVNNKLSDKWPDVEIYGAGPFLKNSSDLLEDSTGRPVEPIETEFTPVLQLKVGLRFLDGKKMRVKIITPSGREKSFDLSAPGGRTLNQAGNMKRTLPSVLENFSRRNKSLVYCHKTNLAEEWAQYLAKERDEANISGDAELVIEYLENQIHPEYPLIKCLRHGVAYHHGKVPEIARDAVESIYEEDNFLETVVSTPTLLQGVNLPCQEIFILKPNKGDKTLSDFDFQNLIGRVGRLSENLMGVVYGVDREGEEWVDEKMKSEGNESVESATDKATSHHKDDLIEAVVKGGINENTEDSVRYTAILLRHKWLKEDEESVLNYLYNKELEKKDIEEILNNLRGLSVEIPDDILSNNPSVDPLKQDILFEKVRQNPESWIFDPKYVSEGRFKEICRELNAIFEFSYDKYRNVIFENLSNTETSLNLLGKVVDYAYRWLNGKSYRELIEYRIADESEGTSTSIRNVIKTVNDDTRFVLVKYFKLLAESIEVLCDDGHIRDNDINTRFLDLDTMLERGANDYTAINLMNAGLSRSVAIRIKGEIPHGTDDILGYIRRNQNELLNEREKMSLSSKNIL
jgi:hypothetical protein